MLAVLPLLLALQQPLVAADLSQPFAGAAGAPSARFDTYTVAGEGPPTVARAPSATLAAPPAAA